MLCYYKPEFAGIPDISPSGSTFGSTFEEVIEKLETQVYFLKRIKGFRIAHSREVLSMLRMIEEEVLPFIKELQAKKYISTIERYALKGMSADLKGRLQTIVDKHGKLQPWGTEEI